ncbi:MAG TPA: hypothetical protein VJ608_03930 [Albitalea sp.]|nr:hypothetical protein [Albitalea sp.]
MQGHLFDRGCASVIHEGKAASRLRHPWWRDEMRQESPGTSDLFASAPAKAVERFGSGASALWDFLGYAFVGMPVGVTATELGPKVLDKIVDYLDRGGRVFVDSGAFGAHNAHVEIDFERDVFPRYEYLVNRTARPQGMMLVMPDALGDQHATLALQRKHLDLIVAWIERGVEPIFPVQNPNADPVGVYAEIRELIGDRPHAVGVPQNKHAWKPEQVVRFAAQVRPRRMHLLGLARERVLRQIARDVAQVSPETRLSCDSCQVIAHAGSGRRLTDRTRSRLEAAVQCVERGEDPNVPLPSLSIYMTDVLYTPGFLTPDEAVKVGETMGYGGQDWAQKFASAAAEGMLAVLGPLDPDEEWVHDAVAAAVADTLYRPWLRKLLAGPIRAYEVARIACGEDPEWHRSAPGIAAAMAIASTATADDSPVPDLEAA